MHPMTKAVFMSSVESLGLVSNTRGGSRVSKRGVNHNYNYNYNIAKTVQQNNNVFSQNCPLKHPSHGGDCFGMSGSKTCPPHFAHPDSWTSFDGQSS